MFLGNHKNENQANEIKKWSRRCHYPPKSNIFANLVDQSWQKRVRYFLVVQPKHIVSTNRTIQRISRLHKERLTKLKRRFFFIRLLLKKKLPAHSGTLFWEGPIIRHKGICCGWGDTCKWIMRNIISVVCTTTQRFAQITSAFKTLKDVSCTPDFCLKSAFHGYQSLIWGSRVKPNWGWRGRGEAEGEATPIPQPMQIAGVTTNSTWLGTMVYRLNNPANVPSVFSNVLSVQPPGLHVSKTIWAAHQPG